MANETRMEILRKQIARNEERIRAETEKLEERKAELSRLQSEMLSEYLDKENIPLDENVLKLLNLAKKIKESGASEKDISDFFGLSKEEPKLPKQEERKNALE